MLEPKITHTRHGGRWCARYDVISSPAEGWGHSKEEATLDLRRQTAAILRASIQQAQDFLFLLEALT